MLVRALLPESVTVIVSFGYFVHVRAEVTLTVVVVVRFAFDFDGMEKSVALAENLVSETRCDFVNVTVCVSTSSMDLVDTSLTVFVH